MFVCFASVIANLALAVIVDNATLSITFHCVHYSSYEGLMMWYIPVRGKISGIDREIR